MGNQSKPLLQFRQPTADELAAVIEFIKLLKKTNQFKVVRVVLLRVRHDLVKDADGFVDPLLNLPEHLHPVWRQIVACTQVWTDRMAKKKKKLVQGLMQRGPMDHLFNLQGAVYGDCHAVMLGTEWDIIQPVCKHLFHASEENLLENWQLGLLKTINKYPESLQIDPKLLLALSFFSPVLTKDMNSLKPWASFRDLRIRLGGVDVCWWVVKILLVSPRERKMLAPAQPKTFCAALHFEGDLPGLSVAQRAVFGGPGYSAANVERK